MNKFPRIGTPIEEEINGEYYYRGHVIWSWWAGEYSVVPRLTIDAANDDAQEMINKRMVTK